MIVNVLISLLIVNIIVWILTCTLIFYSITQFFRKNNWFQTDRKTYFFLLGISVVSLFFKGIPLLIRVMSDKQQYFNFIKKIELATSDFIHDARN